jgi:hypothetical protein
MDKKLAELVRVLKEMQDSSQNEVAAFLRKDDRETCEYYRGRLDACREAIKLIEVVVGFGS